MTAQAMAAIEAKGEDGAARIRVSRNETADGCEVKRSKGHAFADSDVRASESGGPG